MHQNLAQTYSIIALHALQDQISKCIDTNYKGQFAFIPLEIGKFIAACYRLYNVHDLYVSDYRQSGSPWTNAG